MSDIKYNPNCPRKNCMGGVITRDGNTGHLCTYCNPDQKKPKALSAGTVLKLTLEEYGYKLSDYIRPSAGLEMAIKEAMKRYADQATAIKLSSVADYVIN